MQRVPEPCKVGVSLVLWSESLSRCCRDFTNGGSTLLDDYEVVSFQ